MSPCNIYYQSEKFCNTKMIFLILWTSAVHTPQYNTSQKVYIVLERIRANFKNAAQIFTR